MANELSEMWSKMTLTEEEEEEILITPSLVQTTMNEGEQCLLDKILTKKTVNIQAMKSVLHKVWRLSEGLEVTEVGKQLFLFYFANKLEKERVLISQPWSFNKALIVLKEVDCMTYPDRVVMNVCPFWVQIHGLPLGMMNENVAELIGGAVGVFLEAYVQSHNRGWGRYLRVRVLLDVNKPLRRVKRITLEGSKTVIASFQYERLPEFCYVCRCLDHLETDCLKAVTMRKNQGRVSREYGSWLKASFVTNWKSKTTQAEAVNPTPIDKGISSSGAGNYRMEAEEGEASSKVGDDTVQS